jgi:succinate dehydrogenase/fumarate reductase cytochrome b subunit
MCFGIRFYIFEQGYIHRRYAQSAEIVFFVSLCVLSKAGGEKVDVSVP